MEGVESQAIPWMSQIRAYDLDSLKSFSHQALLATTKTIESPTFHSWFYPHGIQIPSQIVRNKKIRENASEFPERW